MASGLACLDHSRGSSGCTLYLDNRRQADLSMSRLAVQIILFHSSSHLEPLLDSLKSQTYRDFEVLFLDNSEDSIESERLRALVTKFDPHATFHVSRSNIGFAGG